MTDILSSKNKIRFSFPLIFMHLGCLSIFFVPFEKELIILFFIIYSLHVFTLTAGFHRYFSHNSFKTSRVFQFILAFLGTMAAQKDPLWWASHHRLHHAHADTELDPHSARNKGFWWAHMGWIMENKTGQTNLNKINDFRKFPELVWLNKYPFIPPILLVIILYITGLILGVVIPEPNFSGLQFIAYGFFLSTVAVYHVTFSINSVAHKFGNKRYSTKDDSVNNWFLAILSGGEGWHNNHHRYAVCTRQGFKWWEVDLTYYILRVLQKLKIVWDIREPPKSILSEI